MADVVPLPSSALAGIAAPGRYGRAGAAPGVEASEVSGIGLASVSARKDRHDKLAAAVRTSFGIDLPTAPRRIDGPELSMIWTGPEQWLAMRMAWPEQGMEALLRAPLAPHAAIADQSHGRVILRLSGPRVRDTLAKGFDIDFHPHVFRPGDTAVTQVAHIDVQIWQLDAAPTYEIAAFRGFAGSLWRWLELAAAEYGLQLTHPITRSTGFVP